MITDKQLTLASSSFRRVPYSTKAEANEQDNRCIFWRFINSLIIKNPDIFLCRVLDTLLFFIFPCSQVSLMS